MTLRRLPGTILLLFSLLGCAAARAQYAGPAVTTGPNGTAQVITTDRSILFPAVPEFKLGPGDLLSIHIIGENDFPATLRIDISGQVLMPYIGLVQLTGLTVTQAEILLQNKLSDAGIYRNPQVTLQVTEGPNAVATLVGEAHAVVPIVGERTLLQVLAAGGGLPATASHIITIDRPGVAQPIVVDLGSNPEQSAMANIPILPGDIIVTSRVGVAYLVGAFKSQGPIPLISNTPMTLMEASAIAGGPTFEAKYSDLRLIRTINGQRTVVKLNIHNVLYGKAPDPILHADDIVFLPSSPLKAAMTNGSIALVVGLASLSLSTFSILRY